MPSRAMTRCLAQVVMMSVINAFFVFWLKLLVIGEETSWTPVGSCKLPELGTALSQDSTGPASRIRP